MTPVFMVTEAETSVSAISGVLISFVSHFMKTYGASGNTVPRILTSSPNGAES
jgi:hypothetical protein